MNQEIAARLQQAIDRFTAHADAAKTTDRAVESAYRHCAKDLTRVLAELQASQE